MKMYITATSGSTVNLRALPNTSAQIIQRLPLTTEVEIIESVSTDWYKVKYQNNEGYIMKKFLTDGTSSKVSKDDLRRIYNSLSETLSLIKKVIE